MKQLIAAAIIFSITTIALSASSVHAQTRHELIRGDMPPGLAADYYRMGNPKLQYHVQPVRVISPIGSRVEVASNDGYIKVNASKVSVGMMVGPVYRFKITNIPRNFGTELYPSIEILNKLNPPEGMENEFPIEVVISEDDLKRAIDGNLVTKVIYLEDPNTALPHRHRAAEQPYFDVGGGEDPLRAAEKLGRPMAILRIGSRVPMSNEMAHEFNFNAPEASLLPDPKAVRQEPNWDDFNDSPTISGEFIPATDGRQ